MDDNPADRDLTEEALNQCRLPLQVRSAQDGMEAVLLLLGETEHAGSSLPDLLFLDLNLPRKDGRAVLQALKSDARLSKIPVVVFTTSQANADIARCYELGANCYVQKPGNLADFRAVVHSTADFWLRLVSLPPKGNV